MPPKTHDRDQKIVAAMGALLPRVKAAARLYERTPTKTAAQLVAATPGFANACFIHRLDDKEIAAELLAGTSYKAAVAEAIAARHSVPVATVLRVFDVAQKKMKRPSAAAAAPSRRAAAATKTTRRSSTRRP